METIDHVVFAWDDMDDGIEEFARLGLTPERAGTHEDGTTQMAILAFEDGSYLELLTPTDAERPPQRWPAEIERSAGPCGWCLEVEDLRRELKRLIDRGVPVNGPRRNSRERPDGTVVEWEAGVYGTPESVGLFPFLISDRTPREYRVGSARRVDGELDGVAAVVLAVEDVAEATDRFQRLYDFPTPERLENEAFGGHLASFPGRPVVLAEPVEEASWLADRLDRYGESPCAYLLGTSDFDAAAEAYPLTDPSRWFDRRVAWFDSETLHRSVGVVEA